MVFGSYLRTLCLTQVINIIFSSNCFMVLCMIHPELIFVVCERYRSRLFIFGTWVFSYSSTIVERLSFLHWMALVLLSKISWFGYLCGLFLNSIMFYWFLFFSSVFNRICQWNHLVWSVPCWKVFNCEIIF